MPAVNQIDLRFVWNHELNVATSGGNRQSLSWTTVFPAYAVPYGRRCSTVVQHPGHPLLEGFAKNRRSILSVRCRLQVLMWLILDRIKSDATFRNVNVFTVLSFCSSCLTHTRVKTMTGIKQTTTERKEERREKRRIFTFGSKMILSTPHIFLQPTY